MPSQNDLEILSPQTSEDLESNQEPGQEVFALEENNQVVQGNLFKGYFQLFRCGLICCLSLLDRQEQQFQQQIFFILTWNKKQFLQTMLAIYGSYSENIFWKKSYIKILQF